MPSFKEYLKQKEAPPPPKPKKEVDLRRIAAAGRARGGSRKLRALGGIKE